MKQFSELGLSEPILCALSEGRYVTPTAVREKVIPVTKQEKDSLGIAQAGTGKTASFVLPLLHRIQKKQHGIPKPISCHNLILVPTRGLVQQIAENIRGLGCYIDHRATVIVGGVKPGPQVLCLNHKNDCRQGKTHKPISR